MIARPGVLALLTCLMVGAGPGRHLAAPPLEKVTDIPLPGPAVRFDYQSVDTETNRLYISHMNAGQLVVFDPRTHLVYFPLQDVDVRPLLRIMAATRP